MTQIDINTGTRVYDYTYDCQNRLKKAKEDGTIVAKYYYDYAGRRVTKEAGGVRTRYCYDGDQVIAEYENGVLWCYRIDFPVCSRVRNFTTADYNPTRGIFLPLRV